MAGKTHTNKYVINRVIQKGWNFLDRNFANFSTSHKIQIALELCKKSMPENVNMRDLTPKKIIVQIINTGNGTNGNGGNGNGKRHLELTGQPSIPAEL